MIDLTVYKGDNESVNYWLILASYCQDDPMAMVGVIDQLEKAYQDAKSNLPRGLREDLNALRESAKSQLSTLIAQKRRKLEQLKLEPEKKAEASQTNITQKKTRTQEIFGDEF